MHILDWTALDRAARQAALSRPQPARRAGILRAAQDIIAQVRREGDAGLRALSERFDGTAPAQLAVTAAEFAGARRAVGRQETAALERAIANVRRFHQVTAPQPQRTETEAGVGCGQIVRPIGAVGLYVPAGTAPLPSTVIMLAVPAGIAGCPVRVLCTPPRADGSAHPAVLAAAQLCGIETVFKVGGAQAIAALAYGTQSIPRVEKIFGPGNAWVTAAKQLVAADPEGAACDLPAGPSEVLVLADEAAPADFVAADLLAQAEHDALSQALLVTDSHAFAARVAAELEAQRGALSRGGILAESLRGCRALVVPDLATALEVVNDYAPEHLIMQLREPQRWLAAVRNAGAVFLGPWSPEPLGDYCAGTNHVLPTDGRARTCSGLSVRDFVKTISVLELNPAGLAALGPTAVALAQLEGLDAHASAVARRLAALASAQPGRPRRRSAS